MYYLFNPERRAWWQMYEPGHTTNKSNAGILSKKTIAAKGYPIADRDTIHAMMQGDRSFAVPVHDADMVSFLERQTEDVDPHLFV